MKVQLIYSTSCASARWDGQDREHPVQRSGTWIM